LKAFGGLVPTGGKGYHGDDSGEFAADATYSNSIITVHQARKYLATTNVRFGPSSCSFI
jgi:hypothetical protein